jgi:hypothetical protein
MNFSKGKYVFTAFASRPAPAAESLFAELYAHAICAGTVLFFRHDVWQRQTPINPKKLLRTVSYHY